MKTPVIVGMKDRLAWRAWLSENHESEKEVWLIYQKKHSGSDSVSYDDAVEEAICFGWIDGKARSLDDDRFMQRFSPRKPKSRWSALNVERAQRMIQAGLMTEGGRVVFEEAMRENRIAPSRTSFRVPPELETALAAHPVAAENFRNLALSHQQMFAAWVGTAVRPETRLRRAERSIDLLAENKKLTDVFGIKKRE